LNVAFRTEKGRHVFNGKGRLVDFERVVSGTEYLAPPQSGKPIARKLPHGAAICAMGLALPHSLELDQWHDIGLTLCTIDRAVQWAIGDWWAYGHHSYGKRAAIAARELPYTLGSLMNLGTVARCITTSFRNEALSFSHHVAVAPLEPGEQKELLARAVEFELSVSKLREIVDERRMRRQHDLLGYDPTLAQRWLSNFLDQARRAERACPWGRIVDDAQLDCYEQATIAEMLEAASDAADAWGQITACIKEYQERQERRSASRVPSIDPPA
jgi:hypothetical protein